MARHARVTCALVHPGRQDHQGCSLGPAGAHATGRPGSLGSGVRPIRAGSGGRGSPATSGTSPGSPVGFLRRYPGRPRWRGHEFLGRAAGGPWPPRANCAQTAADSVHPVPWGCARQTGSIEPLASPAGSQNRSGEPIAAQVAALEQDRAGAEGASSAAALPWPPWGWGGPTALRPPASSGVKTAASGRSGAVTPQLVRLQQQLAVAGHQDGIHDEGRQPLAAPPRQRRSRITAAEPSIPVLAAADARSPTTASICARTRGPGRTRASWTPSVFCAVTRSESARAPHPERLERLEVRLDPRAHRQSRIQRW